MVLAGVAGAVLFLPVTPTAAVSTGTVADDSYRFAAKVSVGQVRACSGVLVDPHWVATAKSCLASEVSVPPTPVGWVPQWPTTVTVGRVDLRTSAGHTRSVTSVLGHPTRNLALARLSAAVTDVPPVRLGTTVPATGEVLQIAGFGRTATEWVPDKLHVAPFTVGSVGTSTLEITGQDPLRASTCKGDVGGPALRQTASGLELVGLHSTSWQSGCLAETETREGSTETRTDDTAGWIRTSIATAPDWHIGASLQSPGMAMQIMNAANGKCLVVPAAVANHSASYFRCDTPFVDQLWSLTPVDGVYFQLRNANNGECLVAPTWGGGNIISYTCGDHVDQHWRITTDSLQSQLQNRRNGQCLVAPAWAPNDVVLYTCGSHADQYWVQRGVGGGGTGQIVGLAGKCVDIPGGDPVDGAWVQLHSCTSGGGQIWTQSGTVLTSSGKCLEVRGSGTTNSTAVQLAPCRNTAAQNWVTTVDGALRNPHSDKCLAVPGGNSTDGTKLIIWTCGGQADQRWILPVGVGGARAANPGSDHTRS
ncbi:RICIN domain-containing protein [Micromonospora sp. NPDC049060]|uniref:RICIN domain-containing protein n=1 Tax=Micromonospora sp. NPDC049060 TaxID=3154828 RepID=UPI003402F378